MYQILACFYFVVQRAIRFGDERFQKTIHEIANSMVPETEQFGTEMRAISNNMIQYVPPT